MHVSEPRPHLAPGLRVVRRGPDHLQIGLYDGRRTLLPRTRDVRETLESLLSGQTVSDEVLSPEVLDHLDQNGCLAWGATARRVPASVAVLGRFDLPGLPDVAELLRAAGIACTSSPLGADVVLVLSTGELDRDRLDPLIRSRTSHLVVRLVDGDAILGPFVVPGVTACLRCVDAHLSGRDPDHVAVTARYVRATARARPDGVPDLDPALTAVALAWAVRDVVAQLQGREPSTWSRTVHLDATPRHTERTWMRHPQCGCCWPVDGFAAV